ncbi:inorganic phosphate transporter [Roseibium marinum]|uniref:Phosphate transporter n=1 Tax=Roseibium marinum TaxID=281252 RepID=A0A2S3UJ46_9HYPH|nr:inorganic phosphate transporter [Roseibium marinum]POF27714.1 PiT family inorganic phosphate transporter [Roseibium marinum]
MPSQKDLKSRALDKDLDRIGFIGDAAEAMGRKLSGYGLAVIFLALCAATAAAQIVSADVSDVLILIAASVTSGYMALNIGANDVANNVGPAVGARIVSVTGALIIAAICESAGALLAGSEVISTVSGDILSPRNVIDNTSFMLAMLTALAASALWINLATYIGAPVSTTHSIIGGILGAGIAVSGFSAINWTTMSAIAASWVISPVLGGAIAAALMAFINARVIYNENKLEAARFWLPVLLGVMGTTFTAYMLLRTPAFLAPLPGLLAAVLPIVTGLVVWSFYRRVVSAQTIDLENGTVSLRVLFTVPLLITAGLLSFAHGANDVANAIGPLAAIVFSQSTELTDLHFWFLGSLSPDIPLWVKMVGAFGISAGLLLFGRRLVTVVGKKITKLSPVRAFCIALATAITVLGASGLGLPVSSTHIAVGSVFGVGFYREWYFNRHVVKGDRSKPGKFIRNREERRHLRLVRRSNLVTIIAAWIVTVPSAALLAAGLFQFVTLAFS